MSFHPATIQNNEIVYLKFSIMQDSCYRELWVQNYPNGNLLATNETYYQDAVPMNIVRVGSDPSDNSPILYGDKVEFRIGAVQLGFLGQDYAVFGSPQSNHSGRTQFFINQGPDQTYNSGLVGPGENVYLQRADVAETFMYVDSETNSDGTTFKIMYKGGNKHTLQIIPLRQFSFNQGPNSTTCKDCSFCGRLSSLQTGVFQGGKYICNANGYCIRWQIQGNYDSSTAQWCNATFQQQSSTAFPYDTSHGCCATAPFYKATSAEECRKFCTTPGYSCQQMAGSVFNCAPNGMKLGTSVQNKSTKVIWIVIIAVLLVFVFIRVWKQSISGKRMPL